MTLRAVVFDFDGLVLDTETVILRGWQAEYARRGLEFPTERWVRSNVGTIRGEPGYVDEYEELERLTGEPVDREDVLRRRVEFHERMLAEPVANPGVVEWVEGAVARGLRLAVASSSMSEWVEGFLVRLGLRRHFSCIATRDTVDGLGKPDPAVYLAALESLGVAASEAAALEDSPPGVAAARAAGIFTVAVPSDVTRILDFSLADLVVDSLADFSLDDLEAVFR